MCFGLLTYSSAEFKKKYKIGVSMSDLMLGFFGWGKSGKGTGRTYSISDVNSQKYNRQVQYCSVAVLL